MKNGFENGFSELRSRRVFITGASRGIGHCVKKSFEAAGAQVMSPGRGEMDLSSPQSVQEYITRSELLEADIFVHCAGVNRLAGIDEIEQPLLEEVFQVNLYSAVSLLGAVVPGMRERRWGRIVLISSLYSIISKERRIAYSASKNALTGLAKTLTLELAPYNILTNCVAPGYVMTEMTKQNLSVSEIERIQEKIPTGRFQSEQDIANLVMFLCSDLNQSITGQLIAVDGGFLCR